MPPVGFEPTVSAGERPKTNALDRAASGTGNIKMYLSIKGTEDVDGIPLSQDMDQWRVPRTRYLAFHKRRTIRTERDNMECHHKQPLTCGNKMPTRCNRGFYCRSYCLLNMFRASLCPSSGAQEYYTVAAACGIFVL